MTLFIAGCGVYEGSLTRELVEVLDLADTIYVDLYTMPDPGWVLEILRPWSGKVKIANRRLLEEGSHSIVREGIEKNVVILSAGDPLIATTHQSLVAEAVLAGVQVRYVPGISGVCVAKAYSGLSYYRFGRTATVPGQWRGVKPYSVIATIYANLCTESHTLLLLDVSDEGTQLSPREAALRLLGTEGEILSNLNVKPILDNTPVIVVERAGAPDARILVYDSLVELSKTEVAFRTPSSLVVPAPLNPVELWILESRLGLKLKPHWSKRVYGRSDCCKYYELLLSWLKEV